MRFAFIIMGPFNSKVDSAKIKKGAARIIGVSSVDEACAVAAELSSEVDCIELCGAFGEEGTRKVIEATDNKIPVGYIVHLPEQDELYDKVFAKH